MGLNDTPCGGSVLANTGCLNCTRCQQEVRIALPRVRRATERAEAQGQVREVIRLRAALTLLELARGRMGI